LKKSLFGKVRKTLFFGEKGVPASVSAAL